ncbi:hypothetical protein RF11_05569 [Thelohanellus kitauei]|uniref:Uncharacterized protein n=1 Tax=Thelohanellus kitauei TaxID=669202 RepID=A0A0C2IYY7_THEKT|nr:hypothetical protein RF11_05569 [Thelohanellus kitauei]
MKSDLQRILQSYSDALSLEEYDFEKYTLFEQKIDTYNACPINQNNQRLSIHKIDDLNKLVDSLQRSGVIRRSHSSVIAYRSHSKEKSCLNNATISDAHPLPRIDETLDNLQGANLFTTPNLSSGYWHTPFA